VQWQTRVCRGPAWIPQVLQWDLKDSRARPVAEMRPQWSRRGLLEARLLVRADPTLRHIQTTQLIVPSYPERTDRVRMAGRLTPRVAGLKIAAGLHATECIIRVQALLHRYNENETHPPAHEVTTPTRTVWGTIQQRAIDARALLVTASLTVVVGLGLSLEAANGANRGTLQRQPQIATSEVVGLPQAWVAVVVPVVIGERRPHQVVDGEPQLQQLQEDGEIQLQRLQGDGEIQLQGLQRDGEIQAQWQLQEDGETRLQRLQENGVLLNLLGQLLTRHPRQQANRLATKF